MPSFLKSILHSYSLLFFSQHQGFGGLLLLVTLLHPWAGAAGLGATVLAVGGARLLGLSRELTDLGAYSFNALLVGLLLGTWYAPSGALVGLVVVGATLALLLSAALGGWLAGRGLPPLSLPFVAVVWLLLGAAGQLPALGLSERGIYWLNDLYAVGGARAVALAQWAQGWPWPPLAATYLRALSSVVLQDSAVGGLVVAAGLLWHSRIAFSLSGLAFGAAYGLALLTGTLHGPAEAYNLGANYMMAAIAVGSVFVVPSATSYGLALLSVPLTAVLLGGLGAATTHAGLPLLSLPYVGTALLLLYVLLLRERPAPGLVLTPVQRYSPEANLYAYTIDRQRLAHQLYVPLTLPFLGAWRVSQGYADGTGPTHLGDWGQALDFVLTDAEGRTYAGAGTLLTDYYCYNKPVLAPADGVVEEVIQHLPDNAVGEVNTRENWGNTVVIRHRPGLYSQLSHLRPQSVPVRVGETVRRGEVVGYCGSSGRSPEPHLHFQVQATPYVGSRTLPYPLAYYLAQPQAATTAPALHHSAVPATGDTVSTPPPLRALRQALALPPGYALEVTAPDGPVRRWEVFTDAYNHAYLRCAHSGAVAYFEHDDAVFYFTAYYGDETAALYDLYLAAYRVPLVQVSAAADTLDALPLTVLRRPLLKWLQDVLAPFGQVLRPTFRLLALVTSPGSGLTLHSRVEVAGLGRRRLLREAELTVRDGALAALRVQENGRAREWQFRPAEATTVAPAR